MAAGQLRPSTIWSRVRTRDVPKPRRGPAKKHRLAGHIVDSTTNGETRTRTGDTTIFRQASRPRPSAPSLIARASDSRLSGDDKVWDDGPKLFTTPRRDLALAFSGDTAQAYPLALQIASAIGAYTSSADGTLELTHLVEPSAESRVGDGHSQVDDRRADRFTRCGPDRRAQPVLAAAQEGGEARLGPVGDSPVDDYRRFAAGFEHQHSEVTQMRSRVRRPFH